MATEPFASDVITLERSGHVGTIWMDRPEARNALGAAFWADLPRAVAELGSDQEVRVVVLAARGAHFSVGLDLKAMGPLLVGGSGETTSSAARAWRFRADLLAMQQSVSSLAECPKPVVAVVQGYCLGGGVDLITACDLRVAAADAVFSVRETKMAMVADLGSLQRLPGIVGRGHVAELAYTGRDIDAARALAIGLVNHVADDAEGAIELGLDLAAQIAANSPLAVQGTKAVLAAGEGRTVAEGLDYVAAWNAGMLTSEDLGEALSAFLERRPPEFKGR